MSEQLQIRIHGGGARPTLVYLPGLHGDWTLVGHFRSALAGRVRFVEITYPRTLTWSLEDYAAGVEAGLRESGIANGWLLAESFGSQVAWPMVARRKFNLEGLILAGGFVRHPFLWGVRLAERVCGGVSLTLLTRLLFGLESRKAWTVFWRFSPRRFQKRQRTGRTPKPGGASIRSATVVIQSDLTAKPRCAFVELHACLVTPSLHQSVLLPRFAVVRGEIAVILGRNV